MAKLLSGKTVITLEQGGTVSVFESENVSLSSTPGGLGVHIGIHFAKRVDTTSCAKVEGYSKEPDPSAHERKVAEHAKVILDQIKRAEDTQINAVTKREKLEAEIAEQERADRVALRFAVHAAIQAGVLESEELTANMRDDHAGYVADMFIKVYEDTDLDSIVNVQED